MAISQAVCTDVDDRIADHERERQRMRASNRRRGSHSRRARIRPKDPWQRPDPDDRDARNRWGDLYSLESTFGHPKSLIERELADHMANWREHIVVRASS